MKKLIILLLAAYSLFGQFKFQQSLPDRYTVFQLDRAPIGATSFKDASQYDNAITVTGNTLQSSTQKKFGDGSIYFDGNGDYLTPTQSTLFDFGSGDLTIDFYVYLNNITNLNMLISLNDKLGIGALIFYTNATTGATSFYSSSNGDSWDIVNGGTAGSLSATRWYHIAIIRQSGYFKIYIDGVLSYTSAYSASTLLYGASYPFQLGGRSSNSNWSNCFMQNIRVAKGLARWTTNFTPPNKPY